MTGAGSGIGKATALQLAQAGCHLVLNDLREEKLLAISGLVESLGRKVLVAPADVSNWGQVEAMCARALAAFHRVDILVNNAGVALSGWMEDLSLEDWEWIMRINFWSQVYMVKALLPQMLKRKKGHLVHVASGAGLICPGFIFPYGVSKFSVVGLAEGLAAQLRGRGVGVTLVCPLFVRTSIVSSSSFPGLSFQKEKAHAFLQRWGISPQKVAKKIVHAISTNRFLVLTHSSFALALWLRACFPSFALYLNSLLTRKLMTPAREEERLA